MPENRRWDSANDFIAFKKNEQSQNKLKVLDETLALTLDAGFKSMF
jgi:hypothetical protein